MNFIIGGISGCIAATVMLPIDYVKVQIQLRSERGSQSLSPFSVAKEIYNENKNIKIFYRGLSAAITRQLTYKSISFGLFYNLSDSHKRRFNKEPGVLLKMAFSITAGAIGAFVSNPNDLSLVRMQNDRSLPEKERRNYRNVFDAIKRISAEEGLTKLWTGSGPTVARAISINIGLMVPFEETKSFLKPYVTSESLKVSMASLVAGIFGALFSLPFDNAKTKMQNMKVLPDGTNPYRGLFDAMNKTVRREGFTRLWVGLTTYYIRTGPFAIISLSTNDLLRKMMGVSK